MNFGLTYGDLLAVLVFKPDSIKRIGCLCTWMNRFHLISIISS